MPGKFTPLTLTVSRGPHVCRREPDGHFYTTDTIQGQIGEFDPGTYYVGHDIGGNSMYPHTCASIERGRVVVNELQFSNRWDNVDNQPADTRHRAPPDTARANARRKTPYGIDSTPWEPGASG